MITNKKNELIVRRGNRAIKMALKIARGKGYDTLYLADQGGWVTYSQYGRKLKFRIKELKTDRGKINFDDVEEGSCIIYNEMPSYAFMQNKLKRKKDCFYIADITGSVGKSIPDADIIVCSFGKNKIINLGTGGLIAYDEMIPFKSDFQGNKEELNKKIEEVPKRIKRLEEKKKEVLKDLKDKGIIKGEGYNILVKGHDKDVIEYCEKNNLDYKLCPMKIKILEEAISIEIQNID